MGPVVGAGVADVGPVDGAGAGRVSVAGVVGVGPTVGVGVVCMEEPALADDEAAAAPATPVLPLPAAAWSGEPHAVFGLVGPVVPELPAPCVVVDARVGNAS